MRQKKACMCWSMAALAIMALIFFFSSDTASASDAKSGVFVDLLLPFAAWLDADMLSFLIRKGAHFSIYALLGICVYMALFHAGKAKAAAAWIICALYACSDELHQMMVMGRSAQLSDVALDSLGALCGILLCLWIIAWKRKRDKSMRKGRLRGEPAFSLLLRG